MSAETRALEGVAAIGGSAWAIIAQANPLTVDLSPWVGLVQTLAGLSPTAILAGILIVLWRRHTAREDAVQAMIAENNRRDEAVHQVIVENTKALQRVADVVGRCPVGGNHRGTER
jgi:hypothetical protein